MRKFLPAIVLLTTLAVSCKKDKNYSKAVVIDSGDVTNNGCGWLLRMDDGKYEKPVYVPSAFQHNNLKVKVKMHSSGILDTCRSIPPYDFYEQVIIDDIKNDLN
ncbi:MAG: hypothetical protein JSS78_09835 [Bacteroidetes bacterium]|nr:hypothetical protein [Bacteroidota bacterium]MBS1739442.1 hypothetical protein [Bacteroidota bacterium]MBS1776494.1 hypothetical protein [Bacteroidota bacterium]MBS1783355.1 hypothetical protein [Bacteroidota bacterium]